MDYVIRRRLKTGIIKKGTIKPLEIKCNGEIRMLEEEELLSPASVAFYKPDFNIHVTATLGFKTPVDVDLLKAKFPTTLCKHPRFSSVVALADMMEKDAEVKWGNAVGYVLLPFQLGLHDDPLNYIRQAKTTVDKKKHSLEAIYTFFMAEIVMKFLGSKVASAVSDRINSHTTIAFSNLAGPMEEIGFYGLPLTFLAPSSYGQPHPVLINFQSYSNKMTIVLAVDEYTIPDPHQLCDDVVESLKLIKDAAIKQGLVEDSMAAN